MALRLRRFFAMRYHPLVRLHCLQHVPHEGLAGIGEWARRAGHDVTATRLFDGDPLPALGEFDFLVAMGGPMGANDEARYPWMAHEKRLIAQAIEAGKKVLGVCLGAQLIAAALGARVYPNPEKEIGWFPIEPMPAPENPLRAALPPVVFHWHGDTFDLPPSAAALARSAGCENQAFAIGPTVLGLQFHLEVGLADIKRWIEQGRQELTPGRYVQTAESMLEQTPRYAEELRAGLFTLLDRFAGQVRWKPTTRPFVIDD